MSRRNHSSNPAAFPAPSLISSPPRLTMHLLARHAYAVRGCGWILCRLWALSPDPRRGDMPTVYAVGMDSGHRRRLFCIGQDAGRARRIFELLIRHTVTPVSLGDVLEELTDELTDEPPVEA